MTSYNRLMKSEKVALMFNSLVIASVKIDDSFNKYDKYSNFRNMCVDIILDNNVSYSDIPVVNKDNYMSSWNKCSSNIDLKSLEDMTDINYCIREVDGLYTAGRFDTK